MQGAQVDVWNCDAQGQYLTDTAVGANGTRRSPTSSLNILHEKTDRLKKPLKFLFPSSTILRYGYRFTETTTGRSCTADL